MLRRDELRHWAGIFGVADEQVRRDHMISHILVAVATLGGQGLVFYGGTALARTHLPAFRLSEDVDFLVDPRKDWAARVTPGPSTSATRWRNLRTPTPAWTSSAPPGRR
jgi:hypothetical protein